LTRVWPISVALALAWLFIPHAARAESPTQFWVHRAQGRLSSTADGRAAGWIGALIARASFYGAGEKLNRHTSNGEVFDPRAHTAAHRTLPFGTRLKVTNLSTGLSTTVRVNDRGPAEWTGRAIDLSRAAAAEIGMLAAGEVRVAISILNQLTESHHDRPREVLSSRARLGFHGAHGSKSS
jgi:rare lipoprotein A